MANTKLDREYAELATRTAKALEGLENALKDMNDTNVLHIQALESHTKAILSIKDFWGRIVLILTVAITMLAGLEKIGKLIGV